MKVAHFLVVSVLIYSLLLPAAAIADDLFRQVGSLAVDNARFYKVISLADPDGKVDKLVAAGQRGKGESSQGYIAVITKDDGKWITAAEELFSIDHKGKIFPVRIRNIRIMPGADQTGFRICSVGRAGKDETGVGFIRLSEYRKGKFRQLQTLIYEDDSTEYTHGYTLDLADLDGDGSAEVIYGGFSGTNDVDRTDVRIFNIDQKGMLKESELKPFEKLSIGIRVNALLVVDLDSDKKSEIVIAGRAHMKEFEKAAIAIWKDGTLITDILDTPVPSRYRCLMHKDLDGNSTVELIAGGRIDAADHWMKILKIWHFTDGKLELKSETESRSETFIRTRALAGISDSSGFLVVGRKQKEKSETSGWKAYIEKYSLKNKELTMQEHMDYQQEHDTRFRDVIVDQQGTVYCAGFTTDKDKNNQAILVMYRSQ